MPKLSNLSNLDVQWVSLVDRAAVRNAENPTEPQRFLIWKRDTTPNNGGDMPTDTITPEQAQASLQKAETDRDSALEAVTKLEAEKAELQKAAGERDALRKRVSQLEKAIAGGDDEPDEDDEMMKADLPPAVRDMLRKRLEKADADAADTRKRLEKAEESAKAERDERLHRDFLAKAEQLHIGDAAELGPVLKRAADVLAKADFDALEKLLKAASEQIRSGEMFAEQGSGGEARKTGAYEEAVAKADEIRKSDSSISQTDALDRVFRENRELERRYLADVR